MIFQLSSLEMFSIILALMMSFSIHELAHAAAAVLLGDPTPQKQGRLSLNPLVHIDIIGFLAILFIGFGWAKPVYIQPQNFKHPRRAEIFVSLAGPCSNLLLATLLLSLELRGLIPFQFELLGFSIPLINIVNQWITLNLVLFIFNMIPIYPLDGSHIITALIPHRYEKAKLSFQYYGKFVLIGLVIFSRISSRNIFPIGVLVQKTIQFLVSILSTTT